ncbi:PREDICTED: uncharacterized protein LOC108745685 [Trachymyrmex septentrionalis]|uniref:uncharacterized protein LOC108745685 n=1 Tax=Trachymyrmex septentrionalis TaxID=34720 RepID=UPI00084F2ED3|nr:PREDICTED: uncharacterized protein LOC108745685 [Trachymyrmex septentrionalis]
MILEFVHITKCLPSAVLPNARTLIKTDCCTIFAQDPNLRQKWINAVGIPDWKPSKSAVVHFFSSELFCAKKIMKDTISNLFCKCNESVKKLERKKLKHVIHNDSCIDCQRHTLPDIQLIPLSSKHYNPSLENPNHI